MDVRPGGAGIDGSLSEGVVKGQGMDKAHVITCDRDILGGTPVFAGTRVPVTILMDYLKAGDSLDRFLAGFPTVTREQALAFLDMAFAYALREEANAGAA